MKALLFLIVLTFSSFASASQEAEEGYHWQVYGHIWCPFPDACVPHTRRGFGGPWLY